MADNVPLTLAGLRRIKDEMRNLETVERLKVSRDIEVARAHGDLKENAEYHAAKEKQGLMEARIRFLSDAIARSEVIDVSKFKGTTRVVFGATVKLNDLESGKEVTYRIVGELESDVKKRWISINSPVARSLIGKSVGDEVTVQSPGGAREFEVIAVDFEDDPEVTPP